MTMVSIKRVPVKTMGARHEPVQPYLLQPEMEQLPKSYRNSTEHITGMMGLHDGTDFKEMFQKQISDMKLLGQKKAAAYYQYCMQKN